MRFWVCDLVVILEGCFSFFFFRLLVVNGDEVVGGGDSGSCCSCGGVGRWFYFLFLFSMVVADSG